MKKIFRNRVKEYDVNNPRNKGKDLYVPYFDDIAAEIARSAAKIRAKDRAKLDVIETVRFGESMSGDYFSKYLKTSRSGRVSLVSAPSRNDPMIKNLEAVRVKDQMFTDQLEDDYARYSTKMDESYLVWQEQAFEMSKQARKAKAAATSKALLGTLAAVAGVIVASNNNRNQNGRRSSTQGAAATALILGGAAAVF